MHQGAVTKQEAKEIINAHGEIIGCKESKMGGARFEFTLKLSEE